MPRTNSPKCRCVPSGRCHEYSGAGCPHNHFFNHEDRWTCDLPGVVRTSPPVTGTMSAEDLAMIEHFIIGGGGYATVPYQRKRY